jgi:hypothetical protein
MRSTTRRRWFTALPLLAIALMASVRMPSAAQEARLDDEQQIGQEVFNVTIAPLVTAI